jgi:hypothetical protein
VSTRFGCMRIYETYIARRYLLFVARRVKGCGNNASQVSRRGLEGDEVRLGGCARKSKVFTLFHRPSTR